MSSCVCNNNYTNNNMVVSGNPGVCKLQSQCLQCNIYFQRFCMYNYINMFIIRMTCICASASFAELRSAVLDFTVYDKHNTLQGIKNA